MDALKRTQEDLEKGRQTLDSMLQRLEREQVRDYYAVVLWLRMTWSNYKQT